MNILVPDNWLRDFLRTEAKPKKNAECLSLCGPTVDKVEKKSNNYVYYIEITTNRVDSASVYGIAREAAAILPRFNIKARLVLPQTKSRQKFVRKVSYLKASVDSRLCPRFTAVLIRNLKIKPSPSHIKERLCAVGERPINNIVDISNYLMHEIGQPVHTFDYDKIKGSKMILRESKKGERLTTLDGKTHNLPGKDIVIEDGEGRLIDLAGIMGGANSAVDLGTKNVLLFVQTYNPINIRKTWMSLAQRTEAAVLFEKGLDPELVTLAIRRGIDLFTELTGGKPEKEILDIYPSPYKAKKLKTELGFIEQRLGITISKREVSDILTSLGFETAWKGKVLEVQIPSFRANDIAIPEDIIEEVARIYGFHNLPSKLMAGKIPEPLPDTPFDFEMKVKNILKGSGGIEVYTLSMVPKEFVEEGALKVKNPLGAESAYMRTSLVGSLTQAADQNLRENQPFHLFEMANVYLPRRVPSGTLPEERMMLAGLFANTDFRKAKGVVESLLDELNIKPTYTTNDGKGFLPSRRLVIKTKNSRLGQLGILEAGYIYYEFDVETLRKVHLPVSQYKPIPKYPAQIEDVTLKFPEKTRLGEVITAMKSTSNFISDIELVDVYKDSYTFRIWYQHPKKTLTDKEVGEIRKNLLNNLKKKFGAIAKS